MTEGNYNEINNLKDFYKVYFGKNSKKARRNFAKSLAAYSLITYIL